ncbi:hypothetical protein [Enterobacter kobei]|uniref:hypothetical protein n=1 Tax=Enterobacter kobei TaxID=208224 RepID=UPI003A96B68B
MITLGVLSLNTLRQAQERFEYVTSNSLGSINTLSQALQSREESSSSDPDVSAGQSKRRF